jgi:hypothetical protein
MTNLSWHAAPRISSVTGHKKFHNRSRLTDMPAANTMTSSP